jgi:hypothetical protein
LNSHHLFAILHLIKLDKGGPIVVRFPSEMGTTTETKTKCAYCVRSRVKCRVPSEELDVFESLEVEYLSKMDV